MLDTLSELNEHQAALTLDPEIRTRIAQSEMAFHMQSSIPELTDLSGETADTLAMYGPDVKTPGSYAHSAIMARRLAAPPPAVSSKRER